MVPGEIFGQKSGVDHHIALLNGDGPKNHIFNLSMSEGELFKTDDTAVFVNNGALTTDNDGIGMLFEKINLFLKTVESGNIIGVHPGDKFTSSLGDGNIGSQTDAKIDFVSKGNNSRVFFGIGFDNFPRIVGGSVVNDNKFKISKSLMENTLNSINQITTGVVDRHNDRN